MTIIIFYIKAKLFKILGLSNSFTQFRGKVHHKLTIGREGCSTMS